MFTNPRPDGSIGQVIRRLRKRKRWKQEALAEAMECSQSTVSHLERGDRLPTDDQRERLIAALGCTRAELPE